MLVILIVVLTLVGLVAALTRFVEPPGDLPASSPRFGAVLLTIVLCGLGAHRIGGHTLAATVFAAGVAAAAVITGLPWLLAGVAALTAFAATVLAVVATRPAKTQGHVVREYLVAIGVALVGAVSVGAYAAPMKPIVLGNVVLLTSLTATLWVAHRLGGGFHGLGKRGALVIVGAVTVLVVGLAYSEALRRWGSPGLIESVAGWRESVTSMLGAVPRPLELFIGFPALVWGLVTRSQLRQGWWVCAFGCLGTAGVATSLAGPGTAVGEELLSTVYSVVIGLVLGSVLWGLDLLLTGPRGRRARQAERTLPLRPEPSRSRPLL